MSEWCSLNFNAIVRTLYGYDLEQVSINTLNVNTVNVSTSITWASGLDEKLTPEKKEHGEGVLCECV